MTSLLPAVVAIALLLPHAITAQTKADFSGSWTMVPARSESPLQTPPVTSLAFHITQTDTALTVETFRNGEKTVVSYPIEALTNPTAGTIGTGTARAYWDGMKFVTERAGTVQGQTVSIKESRSLNADRTEMTVETLVVVQHGYSLKDTRNYGAAKDVFTRTR